MIKLEKPLIFFDLETTGVDVKKERIVSISAHKFMIDGSCDKKNMLINPTIPIPIRSTEVHGITDAMVEQAPTFKQVAKGMHSWFSDSDVGGFNIMDYDIPLLGMEFYRCGIEWVHGNVLDVYEMERRINRHNLADTYKRYIGKDMENAHEAEADNLATVAIFEAMMDVHKEKYPADAVELHKILFSHRKQTIDFAKVFYLEDGILRWNINPKKDLAVDKSDSGFYNWFMSKDFSQQSKDIYKRFMSS